MRVLVAALLVAVAVGVSATSAGASTVRCNKHVANLKVYSASGMSCAAAARDLGRSLNVCCQASFRSSGGFRCTSTSFNGRCVLSRRSYRFNIAGE